MGFLLPYIAKRILTLIPILLFVSALVFFLIRLKWTPWDPKGSGG